MDDARAGPRPEGALHVTEGVGGAPSINPLLQTGPRRALLSADAYVEAIRAGDRVLLSQAITLVESAQPAHQPLARAIVDGCLPHAGHSFRVGITGVPGVGKSTFIEALGGHLTAAGRRLAVLTIDPSSTRTKGSILGDKTRMPTLAADPHAFIRPSPSAGSLGGVARSTRETIYLCEAGGFDTVIVETVGVGQSEVAVHAMVDAFLLLVLAGAGDELQGIKRGIIEQADVLAVTKADGPNEAAAQRARGAYRNALHLFPTPASGWQPRVLTCSALTGEGIPDVWVTLEAFLAHAQSSGSFGQQRREQAHTWMMQSIEQQLRSHFFSDARVQHALQALEPQVRAGTLSSSSAAAQLLRLYFGPASQASDPGA